MNKEQDRKTISWHHIGGYFLRLVQDEQSEGVERLM